MTLSAKRSSHTDFKYPTTFAGQMVVLMTTLHPYTLLNKIRLRLMSFTQFNCLCYVFLFVLRTINNVHSSNMNTLFIKIEVHNNYCCHYMIEYLDLCLVSASLYELKYDGSALTLKIPGNIFKKYTENETR